MACKFMLSQNTHVYLIALAINNNMEKPMSLKDIYEYIMENYPFYHHPENGGWKACIRHSHQHK